MSRRTKSAGHSGWKSIFAVFLGGFLIVPGNLGSETLTMVTTYPSPMGIYKNIITTQGATLASSGGNILLAPGGGGVVGIGTATPSQKLEVNGNIDIDAIGCPAPIGSTNGGYGSFMVNGGEVLRTCDAFNTVVNPVNQGGSSYINWDYGQGIFLGNGGGSPLMIITANQFVPLPWTGLQQAGMQLTTNSFFLGAYNQFNGLVDFQGTSVFNGSVGIGDSPQYPLDVLAQVGSSFPGNYGFLSNAYPQPWGNYLGGAQGIGYSIHAGGAILSDSRMISTEFDAISDARVKTAISARDPVADLQILEKLRPIEYQYIDSIANGPVRKAGFIAQEVESILPSAVSRSANFIPSIFEKAVKVRLDPKTHVLELATSRPHGLKAGDEVKLILEKTEKRSKVSKILSATAFQIADWNESVGEIFVWGKKVDDFRTLDYDQMTAFELSALKGLKLEVDELKTENASLRAKLNKIEKHLAAGEMSKRP